MGDFLGLGTGGDAAEAIAQANLQGIAELRRQFDKAETNVQPFIDAGVGALGDVVGGSGLEGFAEALRKIFSGGALDPLIDERTEATQRQLAAGGLTRSGTALREIANIPTQLGLDIEGLLFGRKQNLANAGVSAGLNLGNIGQSSASNIANLFQDTGRARSSGIITDQQTKAGAFDQIGSIFSTALPIISNFFLGGGSAAGAGALTGAAAFSDPNLKANIEEIGTFEVADPDKNLTLYQWDWIPEAEETIVSAYPTMGFMADEVEEKYPHHVSHFAGFKTINYLDLLDELEVTNENFKKFIAEHPTEIEAN